MYTQHQIALTHWKYLEHFSQIPAQKPTAEQIRQVVKEIETQKLLQAMHAL